MFTVYWFHSNAEAKTTTTNDFRTACIIGYNEITFLGAEVAHIISGETGEILRFYYNLQD